MYTEFIRFVVANGFKETEAVTPFIKPAIFLATANVNLLFVLSQLFIYSNIMEKRLWALIIKANPRRNIHNETCLKTHPK